MDHAAKIDHVAAKTVLFFYSGSADVAPGKGVGETLGSPDALAVIGDLAAIPHWRRKLSNFYPCDFVIDGFVWSSVEHYYQASKFRRGNPSFYRKFASEDTSADGVHEHVFAFRSPQEAKRAGGKTGGGLRPGQIKVDHDFFEAVDGAPPRGLEEMRRALVAKFTQPVFRELLLATGSAELTHGTRGVPTTPQTTLMEIRSAIHRGEL